MTTALLIKGHLISPTHVELDEPVSCGSGDVEVLVRSPMQGETGGDEPWGDYLARLPVGTRTVADINSQIAQERESWGD